jgi:hypothetical protein
MINRCQLVVLFAGKDVRTDDNMSFVWLNPTFVLTITGVIVLLILIFTNRLPTVNTWQTFLNCFETKGGQLMLLWVTDMIFLAIIVHSWGGWSPTLQNTVVGVFAGVNGAFLGAVGSKNTSTDGNGGSLPGAQVRAVTDTHEEVIRPAVPPIVAPPPAPQPIIPPKVLGE